MTTGCKFVACKHLDYSDNYIAKKQILGTGKVFWLREAPYPDAPVMVNFCQKRGRLNSAESCHTPNKAMCSDYEDFEHVVTVPDP